MEAGRMQLSITGRGVDITEYTRSYVEKKMQRVDRHLPGLTEARIELAAENAHGTDRNVAQVTLRAGGKILRGEERAGDLFMAIDLVMEKIVRQVDRFKEKRQQRYRKGARENTAGADIEALIAEEEGGDEDDTYRPIVKTKRFQTSPMLPEEAIEQMELLGHTFFVFFNASDGKINVIYRRTVGDYGLLIPDLA